MSSVVVSYVVTRPCPTTATPVPQKAFKRLEDLWRRDRKRGKSTGQPPRAATPSPSKGKKRSKEERQEGNVNEKARKLFAADEQLLELCNEVGLLQFRLLFLFLCSIFVSFATKNLVAKLTKMEQRNKKNKIEQNDAQPVGT